MSEIRFAMERRGRVLASIVAVVFLSLLVPVRSLAQSQGTILGTVKDSSGAVLPQTKVTIINTDTNATRTVTSGDDGAFRVPGLEAGHYSVRFGKEGFKTETRTGLTLEVAQEMVVSPVLEVGTAVQTVTVTGEAPLVDTTSNSLGGFVNEAKISDLPLNGRNYTDLALMQPGITIASNEVSSTGQGGVRGYWFSNDGSAVRANMFTLDGAIVLNERGGATASESGTSLGVDGIKEYRVVTGVYGAEYGMVSGAHVVMISKGGTNQWHGDAFEYLRNSVLDAANYFDTPVAANNFRRLPVFIRNNFGGSAGGPIRKDKTFVFAAYEGLRLRLGQTLIDTVPGAGCHGVGGTNTGQVTSTACPQLGSGAATITIAPVMSAILALYPNPNLPNNQYTYAADSPSNVDWGQIRLDQNISATDTFFVRYTTDQSNLVSSSISLLGASGVGFPQFAGGFTSSDKFATISENHIFSPAALNTMRLSYSRTIFEESNLYPGGAASVTGPQYSFVTGLPIGNITLSGYSAFGPNANEPQGGTQNIYMLNDDFYYAKGKHALQFGAEISKYNTGAYNPNRGIGAVTFSSLAGFLQGLPANYVAAQTGAQFHRNWMYWIPGFYVQDTWRALPRLVVNMGLRYEFMSEPHDTGKNSYALVHLTDATYTQGPPWAPMSKLHFSPRVGFAWDMLGNGKMAVRGGFGQYYDIGNLGNLWTSSFVYPPLDAPRTHVPAAGATTPFTLPLTFLPTDSVAIQSPAWNLLNPYMLKWSLSIDRQLPWDTALQVAYVGTHGVHQYIAIDGNTTASTIVGSQPYWNGTETRLNPNFSSDLSVNNAGKSSYNGMQVALNKHLSSGLELQMSYTYSKDLDNTGSPLGPGDCTGASGMSVGDYFGPGNSAFLYGPSCSDITHNLRFNAMYHIPDIKSRNFAAKLEHGWWMASVWSAQTGYPFTPILGTQRSQSQILVNNSAVDYANVATSADAANCPAVSATCKVAPVPFNNKTVIQHKPTQWFNPNMFTMAPVVSTPGGTAVCGTAGTTCGKGTTWGTLGNVQRGLLRGPGLQEVDLAINKDTRAPFLGELGMLEFRAEIFNILNHPNFAMPNGTVFSGKVTDYGPYSESPSTSAGVISATVTTSRQVQFALKVIF